MSMMLAMAGITLAIATARLNDYLDAEAKVLGGQEKKIGDRMLKRADLAEIQAGIRIWDSRVKDLSGQAIGRGRGRTLRPNF